jgi:hypothetical protein
LGTKRRMCDVFDEAVQGRLCEREVRHVARVMLGGVDELVDAVRLA